MFTAVWAFINTVVPKSIIEAIGEYVKTEQRLNNPVYFEEPCLSLSSSCTNEFDVIFSGLHLTCEEKRFFFTKCCDKGQNNNI